MNKNLSQAKRLKVVIIGIENSGKTTLVKHLSPGAKSIEHFDANGESITVGLDIGVISLAGYALHFFGTPGHARFEFARKIVSHGAHIGILMLDSVEAAKAGISQRDKDFEQELMAKNIPYFVCANKQDVPGALALPEIAPHFNADVYPISARDGQGVDALRADLVNLIESKSNDWWSPTAKSA